MYLVSSEQEAREAGRGKEGRLGTKILAIIFFKKRLHIYALIYNMMCVCV